jgi:hypothetical protein
MTASEFTGEQLDQLETATQAATAGPWHPYFTTQGDTYVSDRENDMRGMHRLATVATSPEDYGRANAIHMAAFDPPTALKLVAAARREQQLAAATSRLVEWLRNSSWSPGRLENHEPQHHTELSTMKTSMICRCGEVWPCPLVQFHQTLDAD